MTVSCLIVDTLSWTVYTTTEVFSGWNMYSLILSVQFGISRLRTGYLLPGYSPQLIHQSYLLLQRLEQRVMCGIPPLISSMQSQIRSSLASITIFTHLKKDVPLHANLLETISSPAMVGSVRSGRSPSKGYERGFRSRIQCQICERFGHLAQRCFYHYNREYDGASSVIRVSNPADRHGPGVSFLSLVSGPLYGSFSAEPQGNFSGGNFWSSIRLSQFNGSTNVRSIGLGHFNGQLSSGPSQEFGGASSSFGPKAPPHPNRPTSNCVEFAASLGHGRDLGVSGGGVYSGATHHVCRNGSTLHDSTPYSDTSSLLIGDEIATKISAIFVMGSITFLRRLHLLSLLKLLLILTLDSKGVSVFVWSYVFVPLVTIVPSLPIELSPALRPASSSPPGFYSSPFVSDGPRAEVGPNHEPHSPSSLPNGDGIPSPTVPTTNIPSSPLLLSSSLPPTNTYSMMVRQVAVDIGGVLEELLAID
ncbi:hypothetical protein PVK06_035604 [Gossypium arboreum]|uniref:Uncharacterized protein n=1 Tax=Gossypium arboreum TaxID=29729 RepID=A0ABR0NH87_GOSAR|nr:hypothetical protein PVK06_035604 [Gossypium arboreum]